jgi:hypothetical protein
MKNLLPGLVLIMLLFACKENSSDCGDPAPTNCELVLMDSLNNYLVGTKYNPDSIQLHANTFQIPLHFSNGVILFNFYGLDSLNSYNYILTLNNSDNDTLNIKISKYVSQCWTSYSIDSISYNHQLPDNISSNRYIIVKQ